MRRRELVAMTLGSWASAVGLRSDDADVPEIVDVRLDATELTNGDTELSLTVRAESKSPVNWLTRRLVGPNGTILGGGYEIPYDEVDDGVWEYTESRTISKWAPDGEYRYENVSVRNEAQEESVEWPDDVGTTIETGYEADEPVLEDVSLRADSLEAEDTELELTLEAESNAPVNWLTRRLIGPERTILGGGYEVPFDHDGGDRWTYAESRTVSKWAPNGSYAYETVSVRNEGHRESDEWPDPIETTIETEYVAEKPVIEDVTIESTTDANGDTRLDLTVRATSNAPVNWLTRRLVGPNGTILGGGYEIPYDEVDDGIWEYTESRTISRHAPTGEYRYESISVRNEGHLESDDWPSEPSVVVGEDDHCFIATAACGTPDHQHVGTLRRFRDETLRGNRPGEAFIRAYYAVSPPIAAWIGKTRIRRSLVRRLIVSPAAKLASAITSPESTADD
ncbi:CFI-box-CTERM domain-containing protein [Halovivax gelatinilyticus]|uniref:CFI-box-CTERM domain-containing protein n=1 Tax=Halovivax gelatinilyticus TaxID=2961597 RepID=UPI0020CA5EA3|nr:CFI-box-CTERM domain-containing protein [Halovivax gelatinilyticus]